MEAEADQLCGAQRYERSPDRVDTRAGSYERRLQTKAGQVTLKVPRLRSLPFETQIIERYRRRVSSVEEALMEMYLAGVSVRRVEDITEALCMLKAIHAQEDRQAATAKAVDVVAKLRAMKLAKAADVVEEGVSETLSYMVYGRHHSTNG